MSKEAFDRKVEALEALRSAPEAEPALRKALKDRSNFYVSKAARIVGEKALTALIPDLLAAFERFLKDPVKSDPQCWAKNAIVKALKDLGYREADFYIDRLRYLQMEPVWGGQVDTAMTLRGACALALADCPLEPLKILTHLVDVLADGEKVVRLDAIRAVASLGTPEAIPLLRLKASPGDEEPEILGACFAALIGPTMLDSPRFVARFLGSPSEEVRIEAASALGECAQPEAIAILRENWDDLWSHEMRRAVMFALGASRLTEAAELLISQVENSSSTHASDALEALARSRFRHEMLAKITETVEERGDPRLIAQFRQEFASELSG